MLYTLDEFFGVFARYNETIWPSQMLADIAGVSLLRY